MRHGQLRNLTPGISAGCIGSKSCVPEYPATAYAGQPSPNTGKPVPVGERGHSQDMKSREPRGAHDNPALRYLNPNGFVGLYGTDPGENRWQKSWGIRTPKRRTGPGPQAVKGLPFRD